MMSEFLDVRTLAFTGGLIAWTVAGIMVYVSLTRRTYPGFHHWTIGFVCGGVGMLLLSLRHVAPDFFSIILANLGLVMVPLMLARGMSIFFDTPRLTWLETGCLVVMLPLIAWFTYVEPSISARIIIYNMICALLLWRCALMSLRPLPALQFRRNWLLVGVCLALVAWYLLRTVLTLLHQWDATDLMSPSALQGATFLISILGYVMILSMLIIVNAQRLEGDLVQTHQELSDGNLKLEAANLKLEDLSNRDGLSGLNNRRVFDRVMKREWQRLSRDRKSLSLIMADIDYFKMFNDTYGHLAGDDCIRSVAVVLTQSIGRSSDVAVRYGGEEFAVVLPDTGAAGAQIIAQAIKDRLEKKAIAHQASPVRDVVTMSFGVATVIPDNSSEPASVVSLADEALYQSKDTGRDRISVIEP